MTRGMIYKLLFILFTIVFAVILILPTVSEKRLKIELANNYTQEQIQGIKNRFPSPPYRFEEKEEYLILYGRNLNDSTMNEVRNFPGVKEAIFLKHWAEEWVLARKINLGLDLQGGMQVVLRADFERIMREKGVEELSEKDKSEITQQALELLRNRIDKFGVSEPSIRPTGAEAIEIQLPGLKDPKSVRELIRNVGVVNYKIVEDNYSAIAHNWQKKAFADTPLPTGEKELRALAEKIAKDIELPEGLEILFYYERIKESNRVFPSYPLVLLKEIALAGSDIKRAYVGTDEYGALAVHFSTTPEGAVKFADVTSKKNYKKRMAIVIDDHIRSAPQINMQITGGQAQITGDFSNEEVKSLASIINEGALPVGLQFEEERTVGPSLGQDSIDSGINAVLLASAVVMFFMIVYYKMSGLIANVSLALNLLFQMALLSWLGFTLTLPGIAGLVLTIGMAVDANVLIYERMKEELKSGKSVRMSIVYGFDRAFWTIFDSNLTTMIAAFILSQYGTGPIKGFAVTLFIGLITNMFTSIYITRFVYEMISLNKKLKKLSI